MRAAGGKRVAQPEAIPGGHLVGDVRERGRPLVGGDHQVRIVAVVAHNPLRSHHLVAGVVVGQVEETREERAIAGDSLGDLRLAPAADRRPLDHEAALGADRDDQRVLDHLRLHQPEDLGAEVLATIRPPQPAARHGAAP
jgi:hypothetical protein